MILRHLAPGRAAGILLLDGHLALGSARSSSRAVPCGASSCQSSPLRSGLHTSARQSDHYQTLEVAKNASQQDIKAQFYKLSKKWHPDVNSDSKNANLKFQQVSEAYATIGHAESRKDYDRQMSSSRHGSPRGAGRGGGGGFRYASDNVQRRASASYAWEYQRRRSQPRTGSSSGGDQASSARAQYHEFGRGGAQQSSAGSTSMFEQFAERERRREAFAAARAGESRQSKKDKTSDEDGENLGSPLIRFLQVAGMFYIVFSVGTLLGSNQEVKKAPSR